jgi:hypothetical protein
MDSKEKRKQYYIQNKDKILEKSKQYYLNNKDKLLTYSKQYYYDNRLARLQYHYKNIDVRKNIIVSIGLYMVINT